MLQKQPRDGDRKWCSFCGENEFETAIWTDAENGVTQEDWEVRLKVKEGKEKEALKTVAHE